MPSDIDVSVGARRGRGRRRDGDVAVDARRSQSELSGVRPIARAGDESSEHVGPTPFPRRRVDRAHAYGGERFEVEVPSVSEVAVEPAEILGR
jgi:hypothetical protein